MKILRGILMLVLLLVVFVATWHFDFLFASVDGFVASFFRDDVKIETIEPVENSVLAGAILENGTFKSSKLNLEEDGYKKYKHLSEFVLRECKEDEDCPKLNTHILWRDQDYIFKIDQEEGSDYYGPFLLDRKEVLDYLKKNKYKIYSGNICEVGEGIPVRKDYSNLGFLGEFFTDIECGGNNAEAILGEDLVTWKYGLELKVIDGSRVEPTISKLLLENGFACVIEGESSSIESIDIEKSKDEDCDVYKNSGEIDVFVLEELHKYASSIEEASCVDCD